MIEANHLTRTFAGPRGTRVAAVEDVSFTVGSAEVFGLLGPNGAGKTTLLRMLSTIIAPSSGHCVVAGARADQAPAAVRQRVGFLSGNTRLYGRLTARELLRFFGRLHGLADDHAAERIQVVADLLSMHPILDRRCDQLSSGQVQRVSLSRVILHDPPVLILDEPTVGLDIMSSRTVLAFIRDLRARGRCVVLSTHYLTEAELLCDRIGLMHRGRLLAIGTTADLCARTATTNLQDAFLALVGSGEDTP